MRISDWSSDVCSSDLRNAFLQTYPKLSPAPLEQIEALEQLRVLWHGFPIAVHITTEVPAAGVDTHEDLLRVRRSEEHTSELQSLMRISYAVFCLKKKKAQRSRTTTIIDKKQ